MVHEKKKQPLKNPQVPNLRNQPSFSSDYSPKLFWREMYLQNHHLTKRVGASVLFWWGGIGFLRDVVLTTSKFPAKKKPRWWFQRFVIFTPIWGRFPICLLFFKGVGEKPPTRKQVVHYYHFSTDLDLTVGGAPIRKAALGKRQETWSKFRERKFPPTCRWFQVCLFYPVTPTWVGRWSNLTIFQTGWNQQLASGILNLELFWEYDLFFFILLK